VDTQRRGGNAARSEAARQRLLAAALRALATNGYQGSSLAGIAADAGMTTAGLLHHFPSKEQLLIAVLVERDHIDGARHHLRDFHGLAALDRLVELVGYNAHVPGLVRAFTVLMGEAAAEGHPAREWFEQRYPRRRDNIAAALRAGIDSGEIRPDTECDAIAAQIIAMMDGLQVQWLLNPDQIDLAAVFAHYIHGVRAAISATPGQAHANAGLRPG
jgi:AcrR family transcriptional regulator